MARPSLFSQLTSYEGPENRLTAAFASVLERAPGLAQSLAVEWTDTQPKDNGERVAEATADLHHKLADVLELVSVRTQVRTVSDKWVDLELRLGPSDRPSTEDVRLWIEIKLGADPHDLQLQSYLDDLPPDLAGAVILVAPRRAIPFRAGLVPEQVPQRTWEGVATGARQWHASATNPVGAYLTKEFVRYMEEKSVSDPEAIRPEHLVTFAHREEADRAIALVCERVSQRLQRQLPGAPRSENVRREKPHYGYGYWESWRLEDREGQELSSPWLDWNCLLQPNHEQNEHGGLFFVSGLTAHIEQEIQTPAAAPGWQRELCARSDVNGKPIGFTEFSDTHERLARIAYPEEVLVGRTLEDQAQSLADWIIAGFEALATVVPEVERAVKREDD